MAQQRQLASPAYLVALALLAIPPFDALMQVIPLRVADPRWRFGFFGLVSNALMIPVCGVLIAYVVADMMDQRRLLRIMGGVSFAVAALILMAIALFALDALQVRKDVKPTAQLAFKVASLTAVAKLGLGFLTFGAFGLAGFRGPKVAKAVAAKRGGAIIVGGAKPSAPTQTPATATTSSAAEPE